MRAEVFEKVKNDLIEEAKEYFKDQIAVDIGMGGNEKQSLERLWVWERGNYLCTKGSWRSELRLETLYDLMKKGNEPKYVKYVTNGLIELINQDLYTISEQSVLSLRIKNGHPKEGDRFLADSREYEFVCHEGTRPRWIIRDVGKWDHD